MRQSSPEKGNFPLKMIKKLYNSYDYLKEDTVVKIEK